MFSKELEDLISASLTDGKLSELEKMALVKRAQKEGVDLDELEIYIESITQQRTQEQKVQLEKETSEHEKLRKGNICPHCATEIPPLTKICPNCNRAVNTNETSGDKELFELLEQVNAALVEVKAVKSIDDYRRAAAECEALINKANVFYGDNKKVQMLVYELKAEIEKAENGAKKAALRNQLGKRWKLIAAALVACLLVIGICIANRKTPANDAKTCIAAVNDALTKGNLSEAEGYVGAFISNLATDVYEEGWKDIESAIVLLGQAYIKNGDFSKAATMGTTYKNIKLVLSAVNGAIENGNLNLAKECCSAYADEYGYGPAEPMIFAIMEAYMKQGDLDEAKNVGSMYNMIGTYLSVSDPIAFKLRDAYIAAGKYDEAEYCFDWHGQTDKYYDFMCACIDHMLETGKQSRVKNYIDRKVSHFDSSLSSQAEWQQVAVKKRLYEYAGL